MSFDPHHTERRLEGSRQLNLQLAAAKAGQPIPPVDPSIIREESFLPPKIPIEPVANPMERYLRLDPQQDAYVVYTKTVAGNLMREGGILRK